MTYWDGEFSFSWDTRFFLYKQHFHKQRQAEIAKNEANAKQHPDPEACYLFTFFINIIIQK